MKTYCLYIEEILIASKRDPIIVTASAFGSPLDETAIADKDFTHLVDKYLSTKRSQNHRRWQWSLIPII